MAERVTVTVPATSANLGPGFDCLGLALELRNELHFQLASGLSLDIQGEGQGILPLNTENIVVQAAERVFDLAGRQPPGMRLTMNNRIPVGSGLGSSAAAVVAGVLGAAALIDLSMESADVLTLAAEIEGHPDNVAPAIYGGLTLALPNGNGFLVEALPVADLTVVVILPEFQLPTARARAALPGQVPLADAIFNVSRMALLVEALRTANMAALRLAMQDRLHQPYRLELIPGMAAAFEAAYAAGASGVALSGAGPSLVALAAANHREIQGAARLAFEAVGLASRSWILTAAVHGATVSIPG